MSGVIDKGYINYIYIMVILFDVKVICLVILEFSEFKVFVF